MKLPLSLMIVLLLVVVPGVLAAEPAWPALPEADGTVSIPAQEWPLRPGPRAVEVFICYPGGKLANVTPDTGLMLSLHNWGGTQFTGTADPAALVDRFNVVVIGVNYLQSGKAEPDTILPYDFGYLQALDALRALWFVQAELSQRKRPFASGRIYAVGGSGGGNVSLMCNKLAPRTFACLVDMSGMARLSDAVAYGQRQGSLVCARYSRDPKSPHYLSPDAQAIRFIGMPEHLAVMKRLGNACKIVVIHGMTDPSCPAADAQEMAANFCLAGLDVDPHFLAEADVDGQVVKNTGHSVGNRTKIVFKFADRYLLPDSPERQVRRDPSDFDLRDEEVRYATPNGAFVISYKNGYPVGRFVPATQ